MSDTQNHFKNIWSGFTSSAGKAQEVANAFSQKQSFWDVWSRQGSGGENILWSWQWIFEMVWYDLDLETWFKVIANPLTQCTPGSMSQIGLRGENVWSRQGYFTLFRYDLDHRPKNLVQGHCIPYT